MVVGLWVLQHVSPVGHVTTIGHVRQAWHLRQSGGATSAAVDYDLLLADGDTRGEGAGKTVDTRSQAVFIKGLLWTHVHRLCSLKDCCGHTFTGCVH